MDDTSILRSIVNICKQTPFFLKFWNTIREQLYTISRSSMCTQHMSVV